MGVSPMDRGGAKRRPRAGCACRFPTTQNLICARATFHVFSDTVSQV